MDNKLIIQDTLYINNDIILENSIIENTKQKTETDSTIDEFDEQINIIMRQTTYNYETASKKYIEHNNNTKNTIAEYMGIKPNIKKNKPTKSINQLIYSELRNQLNQTTQRY
jgi:hypothetical protein